MWWFMINFHTQKKMKNCCAIRVNWGIYGNRIRKIKTDTAERHIFNLHKNFLFILDCVKFINSKKKYQKVYGSFLSGGLVLLCERKNSNLYELNIRILMTLAFFNIFFSVLAKKSRHYFYQVIFFHQNCMQ